MLKRFCDGLTRRDMLKVGVMGGTGLAWSDLLRCSQAGEGGAKLPSSADSVLFVNLAGGPAHLDTLDMKPEGPAETRGPYQPIDSSLAGLQVCEHLPQLSKLMDRCTLIRGIHHTAGAHPLGQQYISTGNAPSPAVVYPSFGSVLAKERPAPPDLPSYVAVPATEWSAGYLGDAYAALKTNDVPKPGQPFQVRGIALSEGVTLDKIQNRQQLLQKVDTLFRQEETNSALLEALDQFGKQAYEMITSPRAREAFDTSREPESISKLFGTDDFSQGMLLACRLIEYKVPFVTVTFSGWDTHTDNFTGHARLLPQLDAGLPAALQTLESKGLLDRTLVVVMGEFGRTPKINENVGRDHYPRVNWSLMAGGGVKPGQIIGASDAGGAAPADGVDIHPEDLGVSLLHAVGIDPRMEYYTRTGRPIMIIPHGDVIPNLFG